jgi:hypothetical protein
VLVSRDYDLLAFTGLCRYVSTDQIARAFFPSEDRARRRLRVLLDAGLIVVLVADSTRPNLVSLTRRGIAVVAERSPKVAERLRTSGAVRLSAIDHHLAIVDARLFAAIRAFARGETVITGRHVARAKQA